MNSIVDYLEHWVGVQPNKLLSSFLNVHGKETQTYTYLGFHERTCYLAQYLSRQVGIKRGDRVLLVYSPGLEIIVAFFACARIGAVPIPVYPLIPMNFEGGLAKLTFVAHDCGAEVLLTTRDLYHSYHLLSEQRRRSSSFNASTDALPKLNWVITDDVRGLASDDFRHDLNPILFLQYTSGSTSAPKGVIVSHENVIHNCHAVLDHKPIGVSWLPQYHDMGLIGYYLFPVIMGGTTYGFSPMDFLKRPLLWLQTLSGVRATYASSPNFGFEYCLREDKIPSDQLIDLDLSSLRVMMNASEPARSETYRRFIERFAPYGLQPQSHVVAYGLAENTLAVTHYGRRTVTVNKRLLHEGTLRIEKPQSLKNNQLHLVSCGRPLDGINVRIVDPKSRLVLGQMQIGEIWVAGESTCEGYWNRPGLTQEVFRNAIANGLENHKAYLRTGDLGFLYEGELFVCGRINDLIIIRGVNYYPQDIESIVESVSQKIRTGGVAAFEADEGETLVVVAEMKRPRDFPDAAGIIQSLRAHCYNGRYIIVFVPARTIVRTTSGKIARSLTRQRWLNGVMPIIATHVSSKEEEARAASSGLKERFHYILEPYNLKGNEELKLGETGVDSLALVRLLTDIEQLLEEHGAADLVSVVDERILQHLTVAEFFALLEQIEKVSDDPISALRCALKKLKQEHDEHERDCMRHDAKLSSVNRNGFCESEEPLTNVLLTGPTGFFGPFLLRSLLQQTPYTYYALMRATDPAHGMNRIRASMRSVCVWTADLDEELKKRVRIVCGDIAKHDLGLCPEQWNSLAASVQAVFHNAALVNYVLNYDSLRPHNVEGTRELLRFSRTGTPKEFHFISSTIIFGWTVKGMLLESDNNENMEHLDFGYAQSKWVAEQLVFAAEKQGIKVRIYRPSFITASSDGFGSRDDITVRLLAFMINHGIAVNAENQISFLPSDIAANNIAAIFKHRRTAAQTVHVTVDDYYNMMDITGLITREYGYPFVYYDIPNFVAEMKRRCTPDNLLYPLLNFFTRSHLRIAAMQHKRYNNDLYREARRLSDSKWRDPLLKDTVSYLMAYMLREGMIQEPPERGELRPILPFSQRNHEAQK